MTILTAEHLVKTWPGQSAKALDDVSFQVASGEFLGIMGASGSGKTTLLSVLSTIEKPDSGSIRLGKGSLENLSDGQAADFRRDCIGFIFQEYWLLDSLTIFENIAVPLTLLKQNQHAIEQKVEHLAKHFNIESQLNKYPKDLSGGQRQRAAAARALVKAPPVVFADEPTGALDSASATSLLKALRQANRQLRTTILMVTHDPYAASYTDRILYFKDGCIVAELKRESQSQDAFYQTIMAETIRQDQARKAAVG